MASSADIGASAEDQALNHLTAHGYTLVQRNFHSRTGEVDLIVSKRELLVFVEVRYRSDEYRGTPLETVNRHKVRRIVNTARFFLLRYPAYNEFEFRFDVIAITPAATGFLPVLNWSKAAFTADDAVGSPL